MTIPTFPEAAFVRAVGGGRGDGRKVNAGLFSQSGIVASIYGTNATNGVQAIGGYVGAGYSISGSAMTAIAQEAINERVRRGQSNITIPAGYYSGTISAARLDIIISVVQVAGPAETQAYNGANQNINSSDGNVPSPETVTFYQQGAPNFNVSFSGLVGSTIRADHINELLNGINAARAVCTCNCNYCTCNCNYCTCNCNYSCTCNCNYSDETLKVNVEYM
jgi:hypothetical protein